MIISQAVGRRLVALGADRVFGLVGSGNFHVTNAMVDSGASFVASAHESGAATMADAYARVSGRLGILSVHQGPGVTNALTGITEAAKARTPLVVLAPEAPNPRSNFFIDLAGAAAAVGAEFRRVREPSALSDVDDAVAVAWSGRTVVLALPLDVQALPAPDAPSVVAAGPAQPGAALPGAALPKALDVGALIAALRGAYRPVFIAGRGAARQPVDEARRALTLLADRCGALLAVSAAAKGLFAGDPWYLDVSGGFATPLTVSLLADADLVVAWGSTLNMWTTRHGRILPGGATIAQVDIDPAALGVNRPVDIGVVGDVTQVALAADRALGEWSSDGWRTPAVGKRIVAESRWRDVSYVDESDATGIDPRTLSIALDDLLPAERTVVVDSGNFMGYPAMYLAVPDAAGFCFTQAFQSVGLGLATAIGAGLARPDRLAVAALGDGGFLMSLAELSTVVRLGLPLVVVVYNDAAYGAEVYHFGPDGHPLDTVTFPDTDLAAIGRGFGCAGATVRSIDDLAPVRAWLDGPRTEPFVLDAKIRSSRGSWWLEEAFRGH